MKKLASLLAAATVAAPAFAGDVVYVEQNTYAPAPQPELLQWFVGGSANYLFDGEEGLYTFHVGKEIAGGNSWTTSLFLEAGYAEFDSDIDGRDTSQEINDVLGDSISDELFDSLSLTGGVEAEIVPVTLNIKFDKAITSWMDFYIGAGAGVAFISTDTDFDDDIFEGFDDSETVFYAQAFLGLEFEVSDNFEIFTGARYIYVDDYDTEIGGQDIEIDDTDDVSVELGARFKF